MIKNIIGSISFLKKHPFLNIMLAIAICTTFILMWDIYSQQFKLARYIFPVVPLDERSMAQLGQTGDFYGGFLNPLLAFMNFSLLIYSVFIQMAQSREDNKIKNAEVKLNQIAPALDVAFDKHYEIFSEKFSILPFEDGCSVDNTFMQLKDRIDLNLSTICSMAKNTNNLAWDQIVLAPTPLSNDLYSAKEAYFKDPLSIDYRYLNNYMRVAKKADLNLMKIVLLVIDHNRYSELPSIKMKHIEQLCEIAKDCMYAGIISWESLDKIINKMEKESNKMKDEIKSMLQPTPQ